MVRKVETGFFFKLKKKNVPPSITQLSNKLKGYLRYKIIFCNKAVLDVQLIKFFIWRKSNISFSSYLDFYAFVKSTDFKIYKSYTYAYFFWILSTIKMNLVKYYCTVWQIFLSYIWLNAGDWKLVPGPFMILLKWQYARSSNFQYLISTIFKCPLFTFSEKWNNGILTKLVME